MIKLFLLLTPMLLFSWEEYKMIDNIKIFSKHEKKFSFVQFKAETVMNASINTLNKSIMDPNTYTSWLSDCIEAKRDEGHIYILMQPPWPLTQRQVLADLSIKHYAKKQRILLSSINTQKENSKGIWFNYLYAEFVLEELNTSHTKVTLSLIGDPGGYPPAWLVNLMAWEIPYKSLRDLNLYHTQ